MQSDYATRRARTDDLTGLLNRKEFLDRLAGLLGRGDRDFALLWCDIDLAWADDAMYRAKEEGRNRVIVAK